MEDWAARASAMLDAAGLYKIPVREWVPVCEGLLQVIEELQRENNELEREVAKLTVLTAPST